MKWTDETRGRKSTKIFPRRYKRWRRWAQEAHKGIGWWPCNGMVVHKEDSCEERKHIAILKWRMGGGCEKGCG